MDVAKLWSFTGTETAGPERGSEYKTGRARDRRNKSKATRQTAKSTPTLTKRTEGSLAPHVAFADECDIENSTVNMYCTMWPTYGKLIRQCMLLLAHCFARCMMWRPPRMRHSHRRPTIVFGHSHGDAKTTSSEQRTRREVSRPIIEVRNMQSPSFD